MRDRIAAVMTRRRLGGAAFIVGGLMIAALVLWPGDDDQLSDRAGRGQPPVRIVAIPELGVSFRHPRAWPRTVEGRVVRLRSPDRSAQLTVSSPVSGRQPARVKASLKEGLLRQLTAARVVRDGTGRLAGRAVESLELTGRRDGRLVRVLALVADPRYRTYAITLITSGRPPRRVIAQVGQIFDSFRFGKPARPRAGR